MVWSTAAALQVDLPGIVHAIETGARAKPQASSHSTNNTDYPSLVENMIREYGGKDNSVVVAVVSCKEDMETQVQTVTPITLHAGRAALVLSRYFEASICNLCVFAGVSKNVCV